MFCLRGDGRMRPGLDGVLLGGQAERVPAHRMKHVEAAHPLEPAINVRCRVAFRVTDVQPRAAGVGEHVEDVELLLGGVLLGAKRLMFRPVALPLGLDLVERIFLPEFRHRNLRTISAVKTAGKTSRSLAFRRTGGLTCCRGQCAMKSRAKSLDYPSFLCFTGFGRSITSSLYG